MATPYHHALSSVKRHGGCVEDYLPIHQWFDDTKELYADARHRALRHHSHGIFECERIFGVTIHTSNGREIPTRVIGEQHVKEDCGFIPTVKDWLCNIQIQPWMGMQVAQIDDQGNIPESKLDKIIAPILEKARQQQKELSNGTSIAGS
jgi:hypothetical protein